MDAVAFVFQDTYIFAESVYDNITMHREVSREAVEQAAKAARCHEFILSLPDGYNTRLGDGGHKLSGGEGPTHRHRPGDFEGSSHCGVGRGYGFCWTRKTNWHCGRA